MIQVLDSLIAIPGLGFIGFRRFPVLRNPRAFIQEAYNVSRKKASVLGTPF